jgi:diaminopimelate decarboxylase
VTARSPEHLWPLPAEIIERFERGAGIDAKPALVDETLALRRCALYRDAFRGAAVSFPATVLGFDALAAWIRRHGVTVDVTTAGELDYALAKGIDPMRIVMHAGDRVAASIPNAVNAGAARFVVGSSRQIAVLVGHADQIQRVVIDATDRPADALAPRVLAHRGLELIGLHCRTDDRVDAIGAVKLREMIAAMSGIRREHGILLTRVSVAGLEVGERCLQPRILRRVAEAIGEVIGDACARHRYPRPALTVSPGRAGLLPA